MTALRQRRPRILLAHPWMGRGGSEAVAAWALQALQSLGEVRFLTAHCDDWTEINRAFGTAIDPARVELRRTGGLPFVGRGDRLVAWQRARFERHCREAARDADLCVSAYNPLDFGRPGLQLIGDFSFSETARRLLYPNAADRLVHRQSPLRRLYLAAAGFRRGPAGRPLAERGDWVVANSAWTAEHLERLLGLPAAPVLYPPVPEAPAAEGAAPDRDPFGFVCLGRISPEKEIASLIGALERVRQAGHPVTLDLAGGFGNDAYERRIRRLAEARRDWIRTPGFLGPSEKAALFATRTFGIHACRVEAFGIAVAEMAAAGLIPFVPAAGATREIVADPALTYAGESEAAARILSLIEAPERLAPLRADLRRRAGRFTPERFMENLARLAEAFLSRKHPSSPALSAGPSSHVATRLAEAH